VTTRLYAHYGGETVGTLGRWSFAYSDSWQHWSISSSLPRDRACEPDTVHRWFANLLPEGRARERIARQKRIDPDDDFALLVALGGECAGALTLDESPEPPPVETWSCYRVLPPQRLAELGSGASALAALFAADDARLSLAGAQDKLPVRLAPRGRVCLPLGGAASTHILKLPSLDDAALVENEAFCLALARRAGLSVVESTIRRIGDGVALLVERYDRGPPVGPTEPGPTTAKGRVALPSVPRRHQEDFAQALGRSRHEKYEGDSGPSLRDCASMIRSNAARPALEIRALVRWLAFCAVIGNRDNHAKNLAHLLDPQSGRWSLAPHYDLVNTTAYRGLSKTFAFRIGGEREANRVSRSSWERQAAELAISSRLVLREVEAIADAVSDALSDAVADVAPKVGGDARLVRFHTAVGKGVRWARRSIRA
jgi:serine/threonine-protein kinase HipA